ncbi:leucine-rich repeat-containing protein 43 isoform X2 [Callorhinchus milii]|uniref:leucine-rich repeat-containing protein 43 isoform X2 n=1 Tax=Callorhinchus milii TaxID=7868 RepID=UPI001C3F6F43|nr:leucine-rich repeat-containing protein 43 isoform X2 [Callorhinchus milii]
MASITAFSAFQQSVKSLCLTDFPCGIGSWNYSKCVVKDPKNYKLFKYHSEREEEEERDVNEEDFDSLKQYLTDEFSPWSTVGSLTEEAKHLKELAIVSPFLLDQQFVCLNLKSLRIVNKHVGEVDKQMMNFRKLQELNLSVNNITTVNSAHLPKTLKVLELCVNEISSLKELCSSPLPDLQHLGLAYNKLARSSLSEYLTAAFWPQLVSLDLSFNNLLGLQELVTQLRRLPNLRNLILQGNPLNFLPQYRGYLIDSLPQLYTLDDVWISPSERHQFTGLSNNAQLLVNAVQVTVSIGNVTGILNPVAPLESNPNPHLLEETIIEYKYFVTYEFLTDEQAKPGDNEGKSSQIKISSPIIQKQNSSQLERNKHLATDPGTPRSSPVLEIPAFSGLSANRQLIPELMVQAGAIAIPSSDVVHHKTQGIPWAEPIVANYSKSFSVTDLLGLKWLLLRGIMVAVMEEKVLFHPIHTFEPEADNSGKKGKKKNKEPAKAARGQTGKGKEKKKKKKLSSDFLKDPPILRTLGSMQLELETLVGGGHSVETLCDLGTPYPEVEEIPMVKKEDGKKSGRKREEHGSVQLGRLSIKSPLPKEKQDKRKLSSAKTPVRQGNKLVAGKGKDQSEVEVLEDSIVPEPEHLKVQFKVAMQHWPSMEEALRDTGADE